MFEKINVLKEQVSLERLQSQNTKARFSIKTKAQIVALFNESNLSCKKFSMLVGVSDKSILNWSKDFSQKNQKSTFTTLKVKKDKTINSSNIVLELKSGISVKGLNFDELLRVLKTDAVS